MNLKKRGAKKDVETLDLYFGLYFSAAPETHTPDKLIKLIDDYGKPDKQAA